MTVILRLWVRGFKTEYRLLADDYFALAAWVKSFCIVFITVGICCDGRVDDDSAPRSQSVEQSAVGSIDVVDVGEYCHHSQGMYILTLLIKVHLRLAVSFRYCGMAR
jgi:hypothetical protein